MTDGMSWETRSRRSELQTAAKQATYTKSREEEKNPLNSANYIDFLMKVTQKKREAFIFYYFASVNMKQVVQESWYVAEIVTITTD